MCQYYCNFFNQAFNLFNLAKMELRSTTAREYNELANTLKGFGCFEDGMEPEEMRELIQAMRESTNTSNNSQYPENYVERAFLEHELEFGMTQTDLLSSTMIVGNNNTHLGNAAATTNNNVGPVTIPNYVRDGSSPETEPEKILVYAVVHHPLDWSPPRQQSPECVTSRLRRKRLSDLSGDQQDSVGSSGSKRLHLDETANSIIESSDSGLNWSETGSSLTSSCSSQLPPPPQMDEPFNQQCSTSSAAISDLQETANLCSDCSLCTFESDEECSVTHM